MASKRTVKKAAGLRVRLDFGGGDVEEVDVDLDAFTYGELAEVRRVLASLTVLDEAGRAVMAPTPDERILAHAWVVLRRSRKVAWSEIFDKLPRGGLSAADVDEVADSPEG